MAAFVLKVFKISKKNQNELDWISLQKIAIIALLFQFNRWICSRGWVRGSKISPLILRSICWLVCPIRGRTLYRCELTKDWSEKGHETIWTNTPYCSTILKVQPFGSLHEWWVLFNETCDKGSIYILKNYLGSQ